MDSLAYSMTVRRNTLRPEETCFIPKIDKKFKPTSSSPQLLGGYDGVSDNNSSQKLALLDDKPIQKTLKMNGNCHIDDTVQ